MIDQDYHETARRKEKPVPPQLRIVKEGPPPLTVHFGWLVLCIVVGAFAFFSGSGVAKREFDAVHAKTSDNNELMTKLAEICTVANLPKAKQ